MPAPQYASIDDVTNAGLPHATLVRLVEAEDYANEADRDAAVEAIVDDILTKRSRYCDGYMTGRWTLPLTEWPDDLRLAVVQLAAWDIMVRIGFNPDDTANGNWRDRRDEALQWLRDVARGTITPVGIVDSTVDDVETGISISSEPLRGWGCRF